MVDLDTLLCYGSTVSKLYGIFGDGWIPSHEAFSLFTDRARDQLSELGFYFSILPELIDATGVCGPAAIFFAMNDLITVAIFLGCMVNEIPVALFLYIMCIFHAGEMVFFIFDPSVNEMLVQAVTHLVFALGVLVCTTDTPIRGN